MPTVSHTGTEITGNEWKQLATQNRHRIEDALVGKKRAALAAEINVTAGHFSKMLSGETARFCNLCALLGLEIVPVDYVRSIERVLKERL